MKVIAFGHRRRVGKDTAANFLTTILRHNNTGLNIHKKSFAYELKITAYNLYGWAGLKVPEFYERPENAYLKEEILSEIGKSPRTIWIELGNKCREIYENTWVDLVFQDTTYDIIFISDLRYPNEADRILELGGIIVKVEKDNVPKFDDVADSALKDYTNWSQVWTNNGSLNDFHAQCRRFAETLV